LVTDQNWLVEVQAMDLFAYGCTYLYIYICTYTWQHTFDV
jgi:hypothetical protein